MSFVQPCRTKPRQYLTRAEYNVAHEVLAKTIDQPRVELVANATWTGRLWALGTVFLTDPEQEHVISDEKPPPIYVALAPDIPRSVAEHHRSHAVDQHAAMQVPPERARQHPALDVAALAH